MRPTSDLEAMTTTTYRIRQAVETDLNNLVRIYDGFRSTRLYRILYPGCIAQPVEGPDGLSRLHHNVLQKWLNSPACHLLVLEEVTSKKTIGFAVWETMNQDNIPPKDKCYYGKGADVDMVADFVDRLERYDELLGEAGQGICRWTFPQCLV